MKTYNGLFENMLDHEEIKAAILEAAEKKKSRRNVKYTLGHLDEAADKIRDILLDGFTPKQHERHIICEGGHKKTRDDIQKPCWWPEQIIHHLMVRQLKRIIIPRMDENICGTISRQDQAVYKGTVKPKGKGALWACKRLVKWRDEYKGKKFYVLSTDIKSFYDTIDISVLYELLSKRIRDKRFLDLCWAVLESAGPGIPKGFYTSPWFAQLYLDGLDKFITSNHYGDHYIRYMDNIWILGTNKRKLRRARDEIGRYCRTELHVRLKGSTQVFRFEHIISEDEARGRFMECLGFVVHENRVTLRKNILKRIRARAYRIHRKGRMTARDASALVSYGGWIKHTCMQEYYKEYIKPKADLKTAKQKQRRRQLYGQGMAEGPLHGEIA